VVWSFCLRDRTAGDLEAKASRGRLNALEPVQERTLFPHPCQKSENFTRFLGELASELPIFILRLRIGRLRCEFAKLRDLLVEPLKLRLKPLDPLRIGAAIGADLPSSYAMFGKVLAVDHASTSSRCSAGSYSTMYPAMALAATV